MGFSEHCLLLEEGAVIEYDVCGLACWRSCKTQMGKVGLMLVGSVQRIDIVDHTSPIYLQQHLHVSTILS
jgi:hypothetical protein